MRSDDVQFVTRMAQHFSDAPAIKGLQAFAKGLTHLLGAHALLAGQGLVGLGDVVVFQPLECRHRVVKAGGGHAPRADRCAHQVHWLLALGQPLTKDEAVQGAKNQPLGTAGGCRYDTNMLRSQSVFTDVDLRLGTCVNVKGLHGV